MRSQGSPAKSHVIAWALWDWAASAFHAVMVTFVFSVYLVDSVGAGMTPLGQSPSTIFSWAISIAGLFIALFAPVQGQQADAGARRKRSVTVWTLLVVLVMYGLFFVTPGQTWFWAGCTLLGIASVFSSFADVSYMAMMRQVSTPSTMGRVSGIGWAMGYFGGIVLLPLCYFGLVRDNKDGTAGLLRVATTEGLNFRLVALLAASWFLIFALPLMFKVPEMPARPDAQRVSLIQSYRILFRDLRTLWREDRNAVWFLLASALYRDGLSAIFGLGAVLAVAAYGLTKGDVLIFGIAANVVAALGAVTAGFLDDRLGPKTVIVGSLIGLVASGTTVFFLDGPKAFWVFGLCLCLFVGPAQSASRTFLTRLAPVGREGELFGLYTTTGKAVSFLAPFLFGVFASLGGNDKAGIFGIVVVLALGLAAILPVRSPRDKALSGEDTLG